LIDTALEYRIRVEMRDGETTTNLLKPTGLLGSNSAKLRVLYSFKRIEKVVLNDCDIIAEIRNEFAHKRNNKPMDDHSHKARLLRIKCCSTKHRLNTGEYGNALYESIDARAYYSKACMITALTLTNQVRSQQLDEELRSMLISRIKQ